MRAIQISLLFLLAAGSLTAQNMLLVRCDTDDACDFRRIAAFLVDGRPSVKVLPDASTKLGPSELKAAREARADQLFGLYRDPVSGIVRNLNSDRRPEAIAVPAKTSAKDTGSAGDLWKDAIAYADTAKTKAGTSVPLSSFAAVLVAQDMDTAVVQFVQFLLDPSAQDPRRTALIRGAIRFAGNTPPVQNLRNGLVKRMTDGLNRFNGKDGDPATFSKSLSDAVEASNFHRQIFMGGQDRELLAQVAAANQSFALQTYITDSLLKAAYWDEFLIKLDQLGLKKWSLPDVVARAREAIGQSGQLHMANSDRYQNEKHLDRAFDEAALAAGANPCDRQIAQQYNDVRLSWVDDFRSAVSTPYAGDKRVKLEQIVRILDARSQTESEIRQQIENGELLDPAYLPLQRKKAGFLNDWGRYLEALDVIVRVERTRSLDKVQRHPPDKSEYDDWLALDGLVSTNLDNARKNFMQQARLGLDGKLGNDLQASFSAALKATDDGLKADPNNAVLLYYRAMAAAFLRQRDVSLTAIQKWLQDANLQCVNPGETTVTPATRTDQMLELNRVLLARDVRPDSKDGIVHWISGRSYKVNEVFYDPISLGFLQPVVRINTPARTTNLTWENRSSFLKSISTTKELPRAVKTTDSGFKSFEAEPRYDMPSLSMKRVASPANSTGEHIEYTLTYLNSPGVDPDLVFRFTGKQIALGWAGNPFFHPFIWDGFYFFDLTYDPQGRVITAKPAAEAAGARADPNSQTLTFTWKGDSNQLIKITGDKGYVRKMNYDPKDGRLISEEISGGKESGSINYEYIPNSFILRSARFKDSHYPEGEGIVTFDLTSSLQR